MGRTGFIKGTVELVSQGETLLPLHQSLRLLKIHLQISDNQDRKRFWGDVTLFATRMTLFKGSRIKDQGSRIKDQS